MKSNLYSCFITASLVLFIAIPIALSVMIMEGYIILQDLEGTDVNVL